MSDSQPAAERRGRALIGVVAASALVYPLLVCAVQIVVAQLLRDDVTAVVVWLLLSVLCCMAVVAAVRWGAARRVVSPWLLVGLVPPALFELWLVWPRLAP
jgi:hypothetical protein